MAHGAAATGSGLQFIVDQMGEVLGLEQAVTSAERDLATRTNDPDFRAHLQQFLNEDQQHMENLRQALRMMVGTESSVQSSIDRGRQLGDAILGAMQETAFQFVQGLLLVVYETALNGRIFVQVQQCIDNREIIGLLETNHYEDEVHLHYLEGQAIRTSEELSGLPGR